MLRETPPPRWSKVPQHFDCTQADWSLCAPQVALISFTLYGVDQREQESKPDLSRNQDFLNFCLVSPHVGQNKLKARSAKLAWCSAEVSLQKCN